MLILTKQERQVILFLLAVGFSGLGLSFLSKRLAQVKPVAAFCQNIGKVDVNSADQDLLISIPGIGKKLAERIIVYRQERNGIKQLEELKEIKGITDYRFERIKEYLYIKKEGAG
jgi:competence ComEA-like helix-hairpin-helix protein